MRRPLPADALYMGMRRQWLEGFPKPTNLKRTREVMREYHDRKANRAVFIKGRLVDQYTL